MARKWQVYLAGFAKIQLSGDWDLSSPQCDPLLCASTIACIKYMYSFAGLHYPPFMITFLNLFVHFGMSYHTVCQKYNSFELN